MTCKDCIHEKVCDALIKSGCPYLDKEIPADAFCMEFRNAADVVPKSEVEWLYKQVDMLSQEVMYNDDIAKMKVDEAKSKVAREIFEEIEKNLEDWSRYVDEVGAICDEIAELKKKYTEGKKNDTEK